MKHSSPIIFIASSNIEKSRQLKQYVADALEERASVTTLFDKTRLLQKLPISDELTFLLSSLSAPSAEQLALKKAQFIASQLSVFTIAEETLLVIPVLNNEAQAFQQKMIWHTSKSKQVYNDDQDVQPLPLAKVFPFTKRHPNTEDILIQLQEYDDMVSRSAYLISYIAFATPDLQTYNITSSRLEGYICDREVGPSSYEFGSIFIKHEYSKTIAEISQIGSIYSRISHRNKAVEKLIPFIRKSLNSRYEGL